MKIQILPIDERFNQKPKFKCFPEHSPNYNVEIDFLDYLKKSDLITDKKEEADWFYLPIMWSFWQLTHNYGKSGRDEMASYLKTIISNPARTFTISEADNEPSFGMDLKVFSANQPTNGWIPIPLLTLPHKFPLEMPEKKYLSNFVGSIAKWPIRLDMQSHFKGREDVLIINNKKGEKLFVDTILSSYSTLCPRGSSYASYRFYESMQLGVVPIMISEYDMRPFSDQLTWDACSISVNSPQEADGVLKELTKEELFKMGENAQKIWYNILWNQKWCRFVIDELCK